MNNARNHLNYICVYQYCMLPNFPKAKPVLNYLYIIKLSLPLYIYSQLSSIFKESVATSKLCRNFYRNALSLVPVKVISVILTNHFRIHKVKIMIIIFQLSVVSHISFVTLAYSIIF